MSAESPHSEENEALGTEFCSGYIDANGKWNNGFYCPGQSTEEQFCCGTATYKYCCPHREQVITHENTSLPLLLGVILGVVAAIVIVVLVSCCFCSCCILYKKRQPRLNGGPLYRMHCSSTASGVANMYSFSNPNSLATTPLDSAVTSSRLLVDLEPVVPVNEGRATMGRGHTFSPETRSTRSPEPPPPYDSSREVNRDQSSGPVYTPQQTFHPAGTTSIAVRTNPSTMPQTPSSATPSVAIPVSADLVTFNPVLPTEQVSTPRMEDPQTSSSSTAPVGPTRHDALYHSTKF